MEADLAKLIAEIFRSRSHLTVSMTGPREALVNGKRLDLENLCRMIAYEPDRAQEIAAGYIDQMFPAERPGSENTDRLTWAEAKPRVMPRIQPDSIFEHLAREYVAHSPFVNGTSIVYVADFDRMTTSITNENARSWGVSIDELDAVARENLDNYREDLHPDIDVNIVESKEGGTAAIFSEQDGYDAARLLLPGLWPRLSNWLGPEFLVAIPARDFFLAMTPEPRAFRERMLGRIVADHARLPYPITTRFFTVIRDGISGDGWPDPG